MSDGVKFTNAQWNWLVDQGRVVHGEYRVPMALLSSAQPTRIRTTDEERVEKLRAVLDTVTADPESGSVRVPVVALDDAGLPTASVANAAYWSGLGDGSRMAYELGYKSRFAQERAGNAFLLFVYMVPLTQADQEAHEERLTKARDRAAARTPPVVEERVAAPVPVAGRKRR